MFILRYLIQENYPIVIMHGLGGSVQSISSQQKWLKELYPEQYVYLPEIGNGPGDSVSWTIDKQTAALSQTLKNNPNLQNGFVAVGFSQGGVIMRHYISFFNDPPVKRFITLSSPLAGMYCTTHVDCAGFQQHVDKMGSDAYSEKGQSSSAVANWWRDPYRMDDYYEKSRSIGKCDNIVHFNQTIKDNFLKLDKIIMFGSDTDGVINPWQAAFFQAYAPNSKTLQKLEDRDVYQRDSFGLKTLNQQNKLIFINSKLGHVAYFNDVGKDYVYNVVFPYYLKKIE